MSRTIIAGAGVAAMMAAEMAMDGFINDGPSRTAMAARREREAAKALRATWDLQPETRQQRRARERKLSKAEGKS